MRRLGRAGALATAALALALGTSAGCGEKKGEGAPDAGSSASSRPTEAHFADAPAGNRVALSLLDQLASCDIEHRGVLVDLGTDMMRGRIVQHGADAKPPKSVEHHGSTWAEMTAKSFELTFTLPERARIFVGARVQPMGAKSVAFTVDDQGMGSFRLKPGSEPRVLDGEPSELAFDAGEHTLTVRFGPARVKEAYAHVDWIRIGFPDEIKTTYGPPTLNDLQQADAALAHVPHRALRLKSPSVVRCPVIVPRGGRFRGALGVVGVKEAGAEVAVRVDGKPPSVILKKTLKGGDDATWEDVDVSLDAYAGKLVQLEMRTAAAPVPGRVLFGDPEIVASSSEPEGVKPAQLAVVIVLSGIDRSDLPGYADRAPTYLERLMKLSDRSTIFMQHRASTNLVPGNMATLFTGLPPAVHTVLDYGAALPATVPTLPQRARDAAVQTAMFTGVPHSFAPSGFGRGLTKFVEISPVEGEERNPFEEAAKWLETTLAATPGGKVLLVVHARGGHPPWHVPPKQLDVLPPENYTGEIQPRRAAQQLAMLRRKGARANISEQDRVRIAAFYQLALVEQDHGVGRILDALDAANMEDHTMLVITSDQSSGLSTLFADSPPYDEKTLELPLYVKFPEGKLVGRHIEEPTGVEDVTATLGAALGIQPPAKPWGRDLAAIASGASADAGPRFAIFGDAYTIRSGTLVLRERRQAKGTLCDLELDPTCSFDRRALFPFATSAILRAFAAYEERVATTRYDPVAVVLDDPTLSALRVWGSMQP